MSTTSVIQAAGPTVVALAAIGWAGWQQRRGFEHAREMADLADTRGVLDDAARALHDAEYARQEVYVVGPAAVTPEIRAKIDAAGQIVDAIALRLAFRLGHDADAVQHFHATADALLTIRREVGKPEPLVDPVEQWRAVEAASARFDASVREFVTAANALAGARIQRSG